MRSTALCIKSPTVTQMARKPTVRRMVRELLAHARAFDISEESAIPDEAAFEFALFWLKGGCVDAEFPDGMGSRKYAPNVTELARLAGVSRPTLNDWMTNSPARVQGIALARESTADFLVDEAGQLLDTATVREGSLAASKANWRKWLAGVYNRKTYGTAVAPTLAISFSDIHLAAHAERKSMPGEGISAAVPNGETVITTPLLVASKSLSDIELA